MLRMFQRLLSNLVPNPDLNPRFNSVYVDTIITALNGIIGGVTMPTVPVPAGQATTTLTAAQSGSLVVMANASVAQIVNLPAAAAGLVFEFIFNIATAHTQAIAGPSFGLLGYVVTPASVLNLPGMTYLIRSTSDTGGSHIRVVCADGVNWTVSGNGANSSFSGSLLPP